MDRAGQADGPLGRLMLAFDGFEVTREASERLARAPAAGVSLFRYRNVRDAAQARDLTEGWRRAAGPRPLLVAADQEGGQLEALGPDATALPGNLALGAAGDPALAERVGRVIGAEARAMGVDVVYAPCCDLATNPDNPGLGTRAFGDDPVSAGSLAAAFTSGVRAAGAAATAKHFPGLGDAAVDSHHGLPAVAHDSGRLEAVELAPFRAAIEAGADLVMSAHVALPAVTGDPARPATLAREVMVDLLRGRLGFAGLTITDALDMAALPQGAGRGAAALAALEAGVDLLLLPPDEEHRRAVEAELTAWRATRAGASRAVAERLARLHRRLAAMPRPSLDVVGCADHRAVARELAERSVTLVRDDAALLPLRLDPERPLLAVMPRPRDLTSADTSSQVQPGLAAALRAGHPRVEEVVTSHPPTPAEIAAVRARAAEADAVVVGTLGAALDPAQVDLVQAVIDAGRPVVTVALRTPWDLAAYPEAAVHVATYGIQPVSLAALARAVFGHAPFSGRLPVEIPGIAPRGHGLPGTSSHVPAPSGA